MTEPKTVDSFNNVMRVRTNTLGGGAYQGTHHTSGRRVVIDEILGKDVDMTAPLNIVFTEVLDPTKEIKPLITEEQWKVFLKELGIAGLDPSVSNQAMGMYNNLIDKVMDMKAHNRNILIGEDLNPAISAFLGTLFIEPTGTDKFLGRIKTLINKIIQTDYKKAYKTASEFKSKITQYTGSLLAMPLYSAAYWGARKLFGKLPVLLGPVPIKHADYVEVARSGKILKFRATGSIFLAHQEGGKDAIKIEGKLYKAEFGVMFMLWGLFLYGQSKFKELESLSPTTLTSITQVRKMNDLLVTNTDLEKPSYEFHQTFPFISRHFILPHCYIETISIEDKLPFKDTLRYSILLRTYEKPKETAKFVLDSKTMYGTAKKTISAEICDYSLNSSWRMINASGWLLDETEWKIGSAKKSGVLDTYYDIDWTTMATVSYLSLMGVAA